MMSSRRYFARPLYWLHCADMVKLTLNYVRTAGRDVVNHAIHMDDLNIFARSAVELDKKVHTAEGVSGAIGMSYVVRKCVIAHMKWQANSWRFNKAKRVCSDQCPQ